eukprot:5338103-Amphidinium_carterae.1
MYCCIAKRMRRACGRHCPLQFWCSQTLVMLQGAPISLLMLDKAVAKECSTHTVGRHASTLLMAGFCAFPVQCQGKPA